MVKLGSRPVKHRHKIVADALYAGLGHPADILAVILNVAVSGRLSQLDVFVNRYTLDHIEAQTRILHLLFQLCDALAAPYLPHRHIINRGNDGLHPRNLTDVLQRYLVVSPIPSE